MKPLFSIIIILFLQKLIYSDDTNPTRCRIYRLSDLLNLLEENITSIKTEKQNQRPLVALKSSLTKMKQTDKQSNCQLRKRKVTFQFSKNCRKIEYLVLKCDGHCQSKTFFYGDKEISRVQGCTLNINKKHIVSKRVYCKKPIPKKDIQINSKFYAKYDFSLFNLQNIVSNDKWHVNTSNRKSNKKYSGYYLINIYPVATCSCQNLQQ